MTKSSVNFSGRKHSVPALLLNTSRRTSASREPRRYQASKPCLPDTWDADLRCMNMKVCPPRSVECLGTFVLKDLVRLVHSDDCSSRGCDYIHIHICICMCVHPRGNCQMCKGVHLPSNTHACMYVRAYAKTHEGRTQDSLKTSKASAFFLLSLVFAANKSHLPWTCRETQTNTRQEVPLGLDMLRDTDTHTNTHTHTLQTNTHKSRLWFRCLWWLRIARIRQCFVMEKRHAMDKYLET